MANVEKPTVPVEKKATVKVTDATYTIGADSDAQTVAFDPSTSEQTITLNVAKDATKVVFTVSGEDGAAYSIIGNETTLSYSGKSGDTYTYTFTNVKNGDFVVEATGTGLTTTKWTIKVVVEE